MKVLNIFICVFAINFISPNTIYLISAVGSIRSKPCSLISSARIAISPIFFNMAIIEELEEALDDIEHHGGTVESIMKLASIAYELGKSKGW